MRQKVILVVSVLVLLGGCVTERSDRGSSIPQTSAPFPDPSSVPPSPPPSPPSPPDDGNMLPPESKPDEPISHEITSETSPTPCENEIQCRTEEYAAHPAYAPQISFFRSNQLSRINAAEAYAGDCTPGIDGAAYRPCTGRGQVIAIADSGFRTEHLSLLGQDPDGKDKTVRTPITRLQSSNTPINLTDLDYRHGTMVASVAAGNRKAGSVNDETRYPYMHGVAFDARLHYMQLSNPIPDLTSQFFSWLINTPREDALPEADRAYIVNFSFGIDETIRPRNEYGEADLNTTLGSYRFLSYILQQSQWYSDPSDVRSVAMINRQDADKTILVWAAGNNHGATDTNGNPLEYRHPSLLAGLPVLFPDLAKNVLVAVALDNSGNIASYSNHCGAAKDFCIAAPGNLIAAYYGEAFDQRFHFNDITYTTVPGTSFAAPTVSGALAVLRQKFPMMGNNELVKRLKKTANKTGRYANEDIYGVGLLDLGAAVNNPVGEMQMSGISLNANSFTPGFSFGDALQTAFSGQLVTGFDELLTPFEYHLGSFVKTQNPSSLNPLRAFHQDWHRRQNAENGTNSGFGAAGFALNSAPEGSSHRISANPNSHLTLAQGGLNFALKPRAGLAFSLFNTAKKDGTPTAAGLSFAWQKTANFGLGGGVLRENEMALQSKGEGVFGGLNANTFFFGIAAKKQLRNWQFHAGAEAGAVFVDADHWLDDVSTLLTSSLSADAVKKLGDRNTLRLGISSPLRVEHGDAHIIIPAGRTRYRELLHRKITPSLVPTGRQIDLTATWSRKLPLSNARVYASLRHSHQPGHRQNADSEVSALLSLELDF